MAKKNDQGEWIDGRGRAIPPAYVKRIDRMRDAAVERVAKMVRDERERLGRTKELMTSIVEKFLQESADRAGVNWGGPKGNIQISNFSGDLRVEIRMRDMIEFDERLDMAKSCIDQYLASLMEAAPADLRVLVGHAFRVDGKGRLNVGSVLSLRKLEIKHELWQKAMHLIDEARRIECSRSYIQVSVKTSAGWKQISLDFSKLEEPVLPALR